MHYNKNNNIMMTNLVNKGESRQYSKYNCLRQIERWGHDTPVVSDIINLVTRNMLEADRKEKLSLMKLFRNIHEDFAAHRTDYYPTSEDEKAWEDMNRMELILIDLSQVFHDVLASDLGEPYLDDALKSESDERFAEEPLGDDYKAVAVDDGLPF